MKFFRALVVSAFFFALCSFAKADAVDYRMNVLDPLPPDPSLPTSYSVIGILTEPFAIVFTQCAVGQLPGGATPSVGEGCFSGQNDTNQYLTSLQVTFANFPGNPAQMNQTPACNTDVGDPTLGSFVIFSQPQCALQNDVYTNLFVGGRIAPGEIFVITEEGVPPDQFPPAVGTSPPTVPEPGSIFLLSTGLLMGGFVTAKQRARLFLQRNLRRR